MPPFSVAIYVGFGGDVGLGHLKRMMSVAAALEERGYRVLFLTKRLSVGDETIITDHGFGEVNVLPAMNDGQQLTPSIVDVLRKHGSIKTLIIDDYEAGWGIERALIDAGYKVVAIDDIKRKHHAGLLIDSKWRGHNTNTAYRDLVPQTCKCLLGPAYYLFDRIYCDGAGGYKKNVSNIDKSFVLLISLGGMPNLRLLRKVVEALIAEVFPFIDIDIRPVVGSQSEGLDTFQKFCHQHSIIPVQHASSLRNYYQTSDLFIGAAGGSIYEAMLCGIPAVTFVVADNQKQERSFFEEIGHPHHFNEHFDDCRDEIIDRVIAICKDYAGALGALSLFRDYYDCQGVYRVANSIYEYDQELMD